jgi:signal transduction histidine kinase
MAGSQAAVAQRDLAQLLLNSLDFGLLALDQGSCIIFVNRKACEIFNTEPDQLMGRPAGEVLNSRTPGLSFWSADQIDPEDAGTREVMLEVAGKEFLLKLRWLPVADRGSTVTSILAFDDVTEAVGDAEFQRHVDRFASVGDLSAIIAHEIRNPLTGIRTTIQYVGSKMEPPSSLRSDLEDAIKELDRIEQFTTDLLQFARPKSFQKSDEDVNPILETVLDNLELQFAEVGITVKRDLGPNLPRLAMDPDAMQQVFLNLVLNAIDAMKGGGQFKVSSSARRYRSRMAVEVALSDTGCGIPEEVIDKIFDPFFTTKPAGTGLGLSISLQIVREHGGRITVRNRSGGGVTFRLSFPVRGEQELEGEV